MRSFIHVDNLSSMLMLMKNDDEIMSRR